jgi:D-tyrosyl-tRNA(Tyr) deacylase
MKCYIQTVRSATLTVDNSHVAHIDQGAIIYVGFTHTDTMKTVEKAVEKLYDMRIFPDESGKTNCTLAQIKGQFMWVPNFTLYGDISSNRRPSFTAAMDAKQAEPLFESLIKKVLTYDPYPQHGLFGTTMVIQVAHEGPFTIEYTV